MPRVTAIDPAPRGSKRRALSVDGELLRHAPADVVRTVGVTVGDEVESGALRAALEAAEPPLARERALRLLAYRDRSEHELRDRLLGDGYSRAVTEALLERLRSVGLLDDTRFAEGLARSLARKGRGRRRVARDLASKGLTDDDVSAALEAWCAPEEEARRALSVAQRFAPSARGDARRLAARLARRGFAEGTAWRAAREVLGEGQDP